MRSRNDFTPLESLGVAFVFAIFFFGAFVIGSYFSNNPYQIEAKNSYKPEAMVQNCQEIDKSISSNTSIPLNRKYDYFFNNKIFEINSPLWYEINSSEYIKPENLKFQGAKSISNECYVSFSSLDGKIVNIFKSNDAETFTHKPVISYNFKKYIKDTAELIQATEEMKNKHNIEMAEQKLRISNPSESDQNAKNHFSNLSNQKEGDFENNSGVNSESSINSITDTENEDLSDQSIRAKIIKDVKDSVGSGSMNE